MKLTIRVKLVLAEEERVGLPGVKVALYDRDWQSEDDLLGTETTDDKGEIYFNFDERKYQDAEDGPNWRADSLPDLYVNLLDAQDKVVYSTRDQTQRDKMPALLTIPVPRAVWAELRP